MPRVFGKGKIKQKQILVTKISEKKVTGKSIYLTIIRVDSH